jgi:hypothetical protein
MIFYAIPDENFFEGRSNVYEALKQRISTIFDFFNPTGVKIRLDHLELDPVPLLVRIGLRLSKIYEVGYTKFGIDDPSVIAGLLDQLAKKAYEQRFGDIGYKRIFVQAAVRLFHLIRYAPENARDRGIVEKALSGVDANPITVASSADMKTDEDEIIDFTDSRNDSDDDSA